MNVPGKSAHVPMSTLINLAIFWPLALVPVLAIMGRHLGVRSGTIALAAPVCSLSVLIAAFSRLPAGTREVVTLSWIPSLGVDLTFMVDGLSLFFGLVVSGMGVLVTFYARHYLDSHYERHGRFYAYLLLFMTAMLGTVFAGNLLLLLVFWELTGLASFLLIGFLHGNEGSRAGARMALLVTAGTGLVMLAGIALVGLLAGTYDLTTLLDGGMASGSPEVMTAAFALIAVGAFGKSAQFPFHFWLPNAMAAPTPVSAYLHSATMVKLGVFLIARLYSVFHDVGLWSSLLVPLCFGTMALAAVLALLSHDLKAILAFSTVSQLGMLLGYYGMAPASGASGDLLHVASHALYKGSLFMSVGIIDHATGIRDVRHLGGLRRSMPLLAGVMLVTAASMAGVIGTAGFISKEVLLAAQFEFAETSSAFGWFPLVAMIVSSIALTVAAIRIVHGVFWGGMPETVRAHFHAPSIWLQLSPALLAAGVLVGGLWPAGMATLLNGFQTPGLHAPEPLQFSLWHGVNRELLTSLAIWMAGAGLYVALRARAWRVGVPPALRFDEAFEWGVAALPRVAKSLTTALRSDRPFDYLPIVLSFGVATLGGCLWWHGAELLPAMPTAGDFDPLRSFVVLLIAIALALVLGLRRWSSQLVALSIVGFLVTFYFVLYQAPDLAMTQILTESATLLLVLLLLSRFPRAAELAERQRAKVGRRTLAVMLAVAMGLLAMLMTVIALSPRSDRPLGEFFLQNSIELAHGTNAVNTILVDFRGFDTLLEITVLLIAALGAMGLLSRYKRTPEEYAAGGTGPAGYGLGRGSRKEAPHERQ